MHSKSSGFFPYLKFIKNTSSSETIDEGVKSDFEDLRRVLSLTINKDLDTSALSRVQKFNRTQNTLFNVSLLVFALSAIVFTNFIVHIAPLNDSQSFDSGPLTRTNQFLIVMALSFGGAITLAQRKNNYKNETFKLCDIKHGIFCSKDEDSVWQRFKDWGAKNKVDLYLTNHKGQSWRLDGEQLWDLQNLPLVIFGDRKHKDVLGMKNEHLDCTIQIKTQDWEKYISYLASANKTTISVKYVEKVLERPIITTPAYPNQHQSTDTTNTKTESKLKKPEKVTLRQKAWGDDSTISPSMKAFMLDKKIRKRWLDGYEKDYKLDKRISHLDEILERICDEPKRFLAFHKNKGAIGSNLTKSETEKREKFKKYIEDIQNKHRSPNCFHFFVKLRWRKIEKYLEELDFISDEELVKYSPELRKAYRKSIN